MELGWCQVLEGHGDSITGLDVSKEPGSGKCEAKPSDPFDAFDIFWLSDFRPHLGLVSICFRAPEWNECREGEGDAETAARMATSWPPIPWTTQSAYTEGAFTCCENQLAKLYPAVFWLAKLWDFLHILGVACSQSQRGSCGPFFAIDLDGFQAFQATPGPHLGY